MTVAPQIRIFIAIELPDGVRHALTEVQTQLAAARLPLRLTRPDGMHLTLAFLGDTPATQIPALTGAVERAVGDAALFTLRAEGLGMFPDARHPRVVWVGVDGDPPAPAQLAAIQTRLVAELRAGGFPTDTRFTPHLTLARVRDEVSPPDVARIAPHVATLSVPAPLTFTVAHLSVMQSVLRREGAVYTRLAAVPLAPEA